MCICVICLSQVFGCLLVMAFVTCASATLGSLFGGGNNGNGPKIVKIIHINSGRNGHGGHYSPPPIINFIVPDNGHGQHHDYHSGRPQIIKVIQGDDNNSGWQSGGGGWQSSGGGWQASGNGGWNNGWD